MTTGTLSDIDAVVYDELRYEKRERDRRAERNDAAGWELGQVYGSSWLFYFFDCRDTVN